MMVFSYIGHRGAMAYEPENTLKSFRRAILDGVDAIELDLRLTRDGALVVMHDAAVDRTTNGKGLVAELTLNEIRALDAGEGERVPTFEEVLETVDRPIAAELKSADVLEPLLALFAADVHLNERVTPISFHRELIERLRRGLPALSCGLITSTSSEEFLECARAIGATHAVLHWDGLSADVIARAHALDLKCNVWLSNTVEELEKAVAIGADATTTNYPARIPRGR
jgi:glycerophosphoryl diester phosphodiesterase